jgi:lipopolysaccharide transport system ATP-binding protein
MSDVALRVENLSKMYRIGARRGHLTLRETLTRAVTWPFRKLRAAGQEQLRPATHWALQQVSFTVKRGEVVGIIGRNGAGKSTLFKILSRVTEPTAGRVEGYGRVGSLLEVGTGFHPELTGRENIYLNGVIMGMRKAEIARKFDDIVAFAEVDKFLDTPVKHYSSGMYVRLAFAVAAHLEPEILIVDEVLAVGDAAFQKKCMGKMEGIAHDGRTVLFVSHNMIALQSLCSRALWLHEGQIVSAGRPGEVVTQYLQASFPTVTERLWSDRDNAPGNAQVRLHSATVHPLHGDTAAPITVRTPVVLELQYWNLVPEAYLNINIQLYNEEGLVVFEAGPISEPIWRPLPAGLFLDVCHIPGQLLNDGLYRVVLQAVNQQGTLLHKEEDILVFHVQDTADFRAGWFGKWGGVIRPILAWDRQLVQSIDGPVAVQAWPPHGHC